MACQMLRRTHYLKVDKGHQHRESRSKSVENAVCDVNLVIEFADEYASKHKGWDHVNDKAVSTPAQDHVEVI